MFLRNSIMKARMSTTGMTLYHDFSLSRILSHELNPIKKTKLVCTIGPSSDNVSLLEKMIKGGLDVARINFSHDNHEIQYQKLCRIREAIKNTGSQGRVGIMLDTKGPEIRTGFLENGKVQYKQGDIIKVTPDYDVKCNKEVISLSYASLLKSIKVGKQILIADGNLTLEILSINHDGNYLEAKVLNNFLLGEKKNVNLPGVLIDLPVITEKDKYDIQDFGIKHDVDFIALSFTRSANCVNICRETLGEEGKHIKIIPKIENEEGLENLKEIVKSADGIMMARGDLGMEVLASKVLLAQKYMTAIARSYGKPVICATQMLESMTTNLNPTRAEMGDVGNAVLDSVDSVMLSGETGNGKFILESVSTMNDICREVEMAFDYSNYYKNSNRSASPPYEMDRASVGLASSAVKLSLSTECDCIIVLSERDEIVRHISNLRPTAYIVFPNKNESMLRKVNLNFGVIPVLSKGSSEADYIATAQKAIEDFKLIQGYRNVVIVNSFKNQVKIISI